MLALPRTSWADTRLEERWLQQLLDEAPSVLPISDIDDRIEPPLVSLGQEVPTDAGPIDNLFISSNGYVVIVETKLFRNPEARRKVVAQILDYAVAVRTWRYTKLNEIARKRHTDRDLCDGAKAQGISEAQWIDRVNDHLENGRMALLVVGDGIRTEAETLVDAVAGHVDFQFRLALVELKVFQLDAERHLVVPSTLMKSVEIERAIVTIRHESAAAVGAANVVVTAPAVSSKGAKRSVLSEEAFLAALGEYERGEVYVRVARKLLASLQPPLRVAWTPNGFVIKMADPAGSGSMVSIFAVPVQQNAFWGTRWFRDQLQRLWNDDAAVSSVVDEYFAFLQRFGAKSSKTEVSLDLATLEHKEEAFAKGLGEIARRIESTSNRVLQTT